MEFAPAFGSGLHIERIPSGQIGEFLFLRGVQFRKADFNHPHGQPAEGRGVGRRGFIYMMNGQIPHEVPILPNEDVYLVIIGTEGFFRFIFIGSIMKILKGDPVAADLLYPAQLFLVRQNNRENILFCIKGLSIQTLELI